MKKCIALFTTTASWIPKLSISMLILSCLTNPAWGQIKKVTIQNKTVDEEKVELRIKVQETNRSALYLKEENFQVLVNDDEVDIINWKSPEEIAPPPARIVFLLDMSGSMRENDSTRTTKFKGAIRAIRDFINKIKTKNSDEITIAIVPFGVTSGRGCPINFTPYTYDLKNDDFFTANDNKLRDFIDNLASQEKNLCASTDLYNPLIEVVQFLNDRTNSNLYPNNPQLPEDHPQQPRKPQLSVILLSDGGHTEGNDQQYFQQLQGILEGNPNIIVHTLGYGYDADRKTLRQIADINKGIYQFSARSSEVVTALETFLNATLGEYEITFNTPFPEKGREYETVVKVNQGESIISDPVYYRILWEPLPFAYRFGMVVVILILLGIGGALPLWLWGKYIEKNA